MKIIWIDSTNGSDTIGSGSYEDPYATIERGMQDFSSSDQIRLKDGTYTPTDSVIFSGVEGSLFSENPQGSYIQPQKTNSHVACVAVISSPRFSVVGVNVLQAADNANNLIGIYAEDVENFLCMTCAVNNFDIPSGNAHGIFAAGDGRVIDCTASYINGAGEITYGIRTKGVSIIDCEVYEISGVNSTVGIEKDGLKYG